MKKFKINLYITDDELIVIKKLFKEYEHKLGVSLCFQNFDEELALLPGKYAEPIGTILLAKIDEEIVGVVALRKIEEGVCEMKRLYVQDAARGLGIGNALCEELISSAKQKGYHTMKLDTLARLTSATKIYHSLGFSEVKPYNFNPEDDVLYFELNLSESVTH